MQLWGDRMKVGDRVLVKYVHPGKYKTEEFPTGIYFTGGMHLYCGKVIKVEELRGGHVFFDGWYWDKSWLVKYCTLG